LGLRVLSIDGPTESWSDLFAHDEVVWLSSSQDQCQPTRAAQYDLVLVNTNNPTDEIPLCQQWRACCRGGLILFTTQQDDHHLLRAYAVGVDMCMVKPVGPRLLEAQLNAWRRRLALTSRTDE
jgi:DNA-binding response OmpR family regulator